MRKLTYLSPTGIALFLKDKTEYYLAYLADNRPEKTPQTPAMAVGSAFDAFVKSYLYKALFGEKDIRFDRMALFEAQVEPQNRDEVYRVGEYLFDQYKKAGCLADLMLDLQSSVTEPSFEIEIMGQVRGKRMGIDKQMGIVPFLGKPDVIFTNKHGIRVIVDWKVNGYYSRNGIAPARGYIRMRDVTQNYGPHKDAMIQAWKGMKINIAHNLETIDESWARQLAIYSWLFGEDVGTETCIAGIDQVACAPDSVRAGGKKIRFAEHRLRIGKDFQYKTFETAAMLWELVNSTHFFREMPENASQERCKFLDNYQAELKKQQANPGSNDDWYNRMSSR